MHAHVLQASTCADLQLCISRVRDSMASLFQYFKADSDGVHLEWLEFVSRADARLQDSFTVCARRSLHGLARVLQSDRKRAEGHPVFVLRMTLSNGR